MLKQNLAISYETSEPEAVKHEYRRLVEIIENQRITTVFQPIVCLRTGIVFAYEALSRIVGPSSFSGPESLFNAAARYGLTSKLERLCRKTALINARRYHIELPITFLDRFKIEIQKLHDSSAIEQGYYESRDREGFVRRFPLLSLSIAVLCFGDNNNGFDIYENLIAAASIVKKKAKAIAGNSYWIEPPYESGKTLKMEAQ